MLAIKINKLKDAFHDIMLEIIEDFDPSVTFIDDNKLEYSRTLVSIDMKEYIENKTNTFINYIKE